MPKSKNKRKNGRAKGSDWNKRIQKDIERKREKENEFLETLTRQILG